jgi:hypothetical protein
MILINVSDPICLLLYFRDNESGQRKLLFSRMEGCGVDSSGSEYIAVAASSKQYNGCKI